MKRPRFRTHALALLLAVLIPAGQAHCLWMASAAPSPVTASSPVAAASEHACCAPTAPAKTPAGRADACPCFELPEATSAQAPGLPRVAPLAQELPAHPDGAPLADAPSITAGAPLDTGPPPYRSASEAHGLRAPPRLS